MSESMTVSLHSGAETVDGTGDTVDLRSDGVGLRYVAELTVVASAVTGTLTVVIESSEDEVFWETVTEIVVTVPMRRRVIAGPLQRYIRVRWTTTGATFTIDGEAKQSYGVLDDLYMFGLPDNIFDGIEANKQWQHLLAATGEVRSYLGNRAGTIVDVGFEAKNAACQIAALNLLTNQVGVSADTRSIELIVTAASASRDWLKLVGRGVANAKAVFLDDTPTEEEGGGYGESEDSRNWGDLAP